MRKVQGTLVFSYHPNQPHILLDGHVDVYRFDAGLEFERPIESGALVTLTLITVPGPNPANSAKAQFDVERIAAVHVDRPARSSLLSLPVTLKMVG
jgi:hypothetical protein